MQSRVVPQKAVPVVSAENAMESRSSSSNRAVIDVDANLVPGVVENVPSVNAAIREKVVKAIDYALVLQKREFIPLAKPQRPTGAYASERRMPDVPRMIPLANRFTETLALSWAPLVSATEVDTQNDCLPVLQGPLTPLDTFAHASIAHKPGIPIKDLRWGADAFPLESKGLPTSLSMPQKDFTAWFGRVREVANLSSNLEFPIAMLEALTQEVTHPDAPERVDGPWMGLLYPYVQAAKESLDSLQKVASEALIHATLFGRDALLATAKVGLVRGQIF
jgi:hypothetical protein